MKRTRKMNNRYIVIVGSGRLGSHLANKLSKCGNSVVIIDRDESNFGKLSPEFSGFRIEGDATQINVLQSAKLGQADILIATAHEDNTNMMIAQVAKKVFGVTKVIARVFDPKHEEVLLKLGIEVICPTAAAAEMFLTAANRQS
ncbi:MAG: TrkA family potassium uptake protein [Candidatus Riflebacteria bacterium]|nr:TrkA family potassium uptake protein [Candidatus Riflebacteria bacterium]